MAMGASSSVFLHRQVLALTMSEQYFSMLLQRYYFMGSTIREFLYASAECYSKGATPRVLLDVCFPMRATSRALLLRCAQTDATTHTWIVPWCVPMGASPHRCTQGGAAWLLLWGSEGMRRALLAMAVGNMYKWR